MKKKSTAVHVALFESDGKVYLLATDDNPPMAHGFKSHKDGLDYFTNGYNAAHDRGYESSMSACINFIFFKPKVISFKSLDDLAAKLLIDKNKCSIVQLSHISGYYNAFICDGKNAMEIYESAESPKLITPKKKSK